MPILHERIYNTRHPKPLTALSALATASLHGFRWHWQSAKKKRVYTSGCSNSPLKRSPACPTPRRVLKNTKYNGQSPGGG